MNTHKIDAIIFDLGGVILDIDYNKTVKAFQKLGFKDFEAQYSKMRQTGLFDQLERGELKPKQFVNSIQMEIPRASESEILEAWNAIILDFPQGRIEYLLGIGKMKPCYLLSNTNEIHETCFNKILSSKHSLKNIHDCFDRAYLSHEMGARKPELRAWQIILDENALNPETTLFIDDSPQHIEAAKELGLKTIHLKSIHFLERDLAPFLT